MAATGDPIEIQGSCEDRFKEVRDTLAANLAKGADVGASVAVSVDGQLVVDIWGGWVDEAHSRAWERDTITNVWSTTKTMTALCALMLADAGELDLDAPVDKYWPEFAAGGKAGVVLVRHLMAHTAGLPGWAEPRICTTGRRPPRCSPPRNRGGNPARRRDTTPLPRAFWWAKSSAG
jgi:CubicO group peptidase (beta-lactamase class C family)